MVRVVAAAVPRGEKGPKGRGGSQGDSGAVPGGKPTLPYLPAQLQQPLPVFPQVSQLEAQLWALQDFCKRNDARRVASPGCPWQGGRGYWGPFSPSGTKMDLLQSLQ